MPLSVSTRHRVGHTKSVHGIVVRTLLGDGPAQLTPKRLIDLVSRLDNVVGAGVTEHAPADGADNAGEAGIIRQLGATLRR